MIYYVTSNKGKIESALRRLAPFGIQIIPKTLEGILELQSEDIAQISLYKAKQAYEVVKAPLIVNDAAWHFTALNGFPGAYMAYMNKWLKPQDFLNLMKDKDNREVVLEEVVTYMDDASFKTFTHKIKGKVLLETQGEGLASDVVITLSDTGISIAECKTQKIKSTEQSSLWEELGAWLVSSIKK